MSKPPPPNNPPPPRELLWIWNLWDPQGGFNQGGWGYYGQMVKFPVSYCPSRALLFVPVNKTDIVLLCCPAFLVMTMPLTCLI